MQKMAVSLGTEVLAKETELDQAFAGACIDDAALHRILADIGRLQGELRYTHLKYHLAMRSVLSPDQIAAYDRWRGYGTAQAYLLYLGIGSGPVGPLLCPASALHAGVAIFLGRGLLSSS